MTQFIIYVRPFPSFGCFVLWTVMLQYNKQAHAATVASGFDLARVLTLP